MLRRLCVFFIALLFSSCTILKTKEANQFFLSIYGLGVPYNYDLYSKKGIPNVYNTGDATFDVEFRELSYCKDTYILSGKIRVINDKETASIYDSLRVTTLYFGSILDNDKIITKIHSEIYLQGEGYSSFSVNISEQNAMLIDSEDYIGKAFYFEEKDLEENIIDVNYFCD